MTTKASRREFLRQASVLSIAGTAAPFALNLASIGAASTLVRMSTKPARASRRAVVAASANSQGSCQPRK